jgi:hypothetical protein
MATISILRKQFDDEDAEAYIVDPVDAYRAEDSGR